MADNFLSKSLCPDFFAARWFFFLITSFWNSNYWFIAIFLAKHFLSLVYIVIFLFLLVVGWLLLLLLLWKNFHIKCLTLTAFVLNSFGVCMRYSFLTKEIIVGWMSCIIFVLCGSLAIFHPCLYMTSIANLPWCHSAETYHFIRGGSNVTILTCPYSYLMILDLY